MSRIGLGAMGMSHGHTGAGTDGAESVGTIRRFLDPGVTFIDTAEIYGPYTNEELVGRAIGGAATRPCWPRSPGWSRMAATGRGTSTAVRRTSAPRSRVRLRRLGTDHVDPCYQHRVEVNAPTGETVGALAELVVEGKIGHIGPSEAGATRRRWPWPGC